MGVYLSPKVIDTIYGKNKKKRKYTKKKPCTISKNIMYFGSIGQYGREYELHKIYSTITYY